MRAACLFHRCSRWGSMVSFLTLPLSFCPTNRGRGNPLCLPISIKPRQMLQVVLHQYGHTDIETLSSLYNGLMWLSHPPALIALMRGVKRLKSRRSVVEDGSSSSTRLFGAIDAYSDFRANVHRDGKRICSASAWADTQVCPYEKIASLVRICKVAPHRFLAQTIQ